MVEEQRAVAIVSVCACDDRSQWPYTYVLVLVKYVQRLDRAHAGRLSIAFLSQDCLLLKMYVHV